MKLKKSLFVMIGMTLCPYMLGGATYVAMGATKLKTDFMNNVAQSIKTAITNSEKLVNQTVQQRFMLQNARAGFEKANVSLKNDLQVWNNQLFEAEDYLKKNPS